MSVIMAVSQRPDFMLFGTIRQGRFPTMIPPEQPFDLLDTLGALGFIGVASIMYVWTRAIWDSADMP